MPEYKKPSRLRYFIDSIKRGNLFFRIKRRLVSRMVKSVVSEEEMYKKFSAGIEELKKTAYYLFPASNEECYDRHYINDYVELNKEYIHGDVLEFAGGNVIYAQKYGEGGGA